MPEPNSNNPPEQLVQYESVRLFIERALVVNPEFRVITETLRRWQKCVHVLTESACDRTCCCKDKDLIGGKIYERLDDRFSLLTGGKRTALPRQQTLRALIDWSYDLLSEEEKYCGADFQYFQEDGRLKRLKRFVPVKH
ncbi:MAG: hypothetical protein IPG02_15615 [Ignavibacteria bacterium]|nr:hypothetical protein [Ignavibacteria bacterium]